jgi:HD-like signal output (HDOD) protein
VDKVVELVSYDETITAQCLRMANSPLFARRRNTETVRDAVMVLGLKRVEAILLGCCLNGIVPSDKWAFDPVIFWRHSLGCALVSRKMAQSIRYSDPEKAYLAGLLHDVGILVNSMICTEQTRSCLQVANDRRVPIHLSEKDLLGFTHCESGKILAEHWRFSADIISAIEFHHDVSAASTAPGLVSLIHLSDLLCRLRNLGYGYYEAMGVDLAGDIAWASLLQECPALTNMDLARLTMDIDGAMEEITAIVDAVFKPLG